MCQTTPPNPRSPQNPPPPPPTLAPPNRNIPALGYLFICLNALFFAYLSVAAPRGYEALIQEDFWVESLTAVWLLLTALILFATALAEQRFPLRCLYILAAAAFLFAAAEEISWGQRIIGFDTPLSLRPFNSQSEFNIHNISSGGKFDAIYREGTMFLCIITAAAFFHRKKTLFGIPLPSILLIFAFLTFLSYRPIALDSLRAERIQWQLFEFFPFITHREKFLLFLFAVYALISRQPKELLAATAATFALTLAITYVNNSSYIFAYKISEIPEYLFSAACLFYALNLLLAQNPTQRQLATLKLPTKWIPFPPALKLWIPFPSKLKLRIPFPTKPKPPTGGTPFPSAIKPGPDSPAATHPNPPTAGTPFPPAIKPGPDSPAATHPNPPTGGTPFPPAIKPGPDSPAATPSNPPTGGTPFPPAIKPGPDSPAATHPNPPTGGTPFPPAIKPGLDSPAATHPNPPTSGTPFPPAIQPGLDSPAATHPNPPTAAPARNSIRTPWLIACLAIIAASIALAYFSYLTDKAKDAAATPAEAPTPAPANTTPNPAEAPTPAPAALAAIKERYQQIQSLTPNITANFNVYLIGKELTYFKDPCLPADTQPWFFLALYPADQKSLPAHRRQHGFDNLDFNANAFAPAKKIPTLTNKCLATIPLPDYPITKIQTGQYTPNNPPIWQKEIPLTP